MEHDEFVGQVQSRARVASRGEAQRAISATLETLAERITAGAADNLAAQLPAEIRKDLQRDRSKGDGTGEQFSLEEFFERVTNREGVEQPDAAFHARAVLEVVDEATTGGLLANVRQQLPDEYSRLFEAGSTGRMTRSR